jgi:hypothetical protein
VMRRLLDTGWPGALLVAVVLIVIARRWWL